jgi:hypothetical protein
MIINYSDPQTESEVGKLTSKQVNLLFNTESHEPESRKLFNGHFNEVLVKMDRENISLMFKESGKPGYLKKVFRVGVVKLIQHDWINHPVLNRSGLASLIWDDNIPNKLRRRLENRVKFNSFTAEEKYQIMEELEKFVEQVRRSFDNS